jgi:transposase InsO family protein
MPGLGRGAGNHLSATPAASRQPAAAPWSGWTDVGCHPPRGDPRRARRQPVPRRRSPQGLGPRSHDGSIIPGTVDTMWGTDLTSTITGEGQAAVFVAVDHCSAECVGIHAAPRATRFEALEPIRQGLHEYFGSFAKGVARGLAIRHDHGSQYMADAFQSELDFLGIESSPAFVRAPEGNGCAERFIRVLKENLLWVRTFDTIEDLRQALLAFRETYNATWLIERHGFITPAAFRQKQLQPAALAA